MMLGTCVPARVSWHHSMHVQRALKSQGSRFWIGACATVCGGGGARARNMPRADRGIYRSRALPLVRGAPMWEQGEDKIDMGCGCTMRRVGRSPRSLCFCFLDTTHTQHVSHPFSHPRTGFTRLLQIPVKCEDAFTENGSYIPTSYDPRCRVWYQDAVSSRDVVFTDPYTDATTLLLVVTVAAPVYHSSDGSLLGVAAIDIDISDIESSVLDLRVLDDEGYAYLLARGDEGYVTVHSDLDHSGNETTIVDLEVGLDEEDFGGLLTNITDNCSGSDTYTKDGDTWFLSWEHETATSLSEEEGGLGCAGGFVAVVTVAEDSLLEVRILCLFDPSPLTGVARAPRWTGRTLAPKAGVEESST